MSPKGRLILAWTTLVVSIVGWPLSAVTFAKDEPPTVLGLSFLAISYTAIDIIFTAQVRNKQEE